MLPPLLARVDANVIRRQPVPSLSRAQWERATVLRDVAFSVPKPGERARVVLRVVGQQNRGERAALRGVVLREVYPARLPGDQNVERLVAVDHAGRLYALVNDPKISGNAVWYAVLHTQTGKPVIVTGRVTTAMAVLASAVPRRWAAGTG
jgi:hypothetical protein